jgi:hypothetical protein
MGRGRIRDTVFYLCDAAVGVEGLGEAVEGVVAAVVGQHVGEAGWERRAHGVRCFRHTADYATLIRPARAQPFRPARSVIHTKILTRVHTIANHHTEPIVMCSDINGTK